jgi:hypothetical protein
MRNRVTPQGIEAPRGAYDGEAKRGADVLRHRPGCSAVASPAPGVFVDSRRESKDRIGMPTPHPGCPVEAFGMPTPPAFLQKSAQTVENKGSEREKERQES